MVYKPQGYNDLSAYLVVDGAARLIEFIQQAFDGQLGRCYERPDGGIMHSEMRIGDSVVMLADFNQENPPRKTTLHLYVPDARAVYDKALAAGAKSIKAPVQVEGDPDLRGAVEDPFGNYWGIGTQVGPEG